MKKELKAGTEFLPSPLVIVSSYNEDGSVDAMAVAWCGICASNPPGIALGLRKTRNTLANIRREGAFVVHTLCAGQMAEGDYFGLVSGEKERDKIGKAGFHTEAGERVKAPVITEFPIYAECEVFQIDEMGEHAVVLGRICGVYAEEAILNDRGLPDLRRAGALFYDQSTNDYYGAGAKVGSAYKEGLAYLKKSNNPQ